VRREIAVDFYIQIDDLRRADGPNPGSVGMLGSGHTVNRRKDPLVGIAILVALHQFRIRLGKDAERDEHDPDAYQEGNNGIDEGKIKEIGRRKPCQDTDGDDDVGSHIVGVGDEHGALDALPHHALVNCQRCLTKNRGQSNPDGEARRNIPGRSFDKVPKSSECQLRTGKEDNEGNRLGSDGLQPAVALGVVNIRGLGGYPRRDKGNAAGKDVQAGIDPVP